MTSSLLRIVSEMLGNLGIEHTFYQDRILITSGDKAAIVVEDVQDGIRLIGLSNKEGGDKDSLRRLLARSFEEEYCCYTLDPEGFIAVTMHIDACRLSPETLSRTLERLEVCREWVLRSAE